MHFPTKLNKITHSSEAKKVGKNFFYLTLLQIGGYVFPLLTMPYLAKVIGVTGFGKIAFAAAIIGYVQTITDWGFNYTTTRDIAKARDDIRQIERIYSTVTWARILLMIIAFCLISIAVICTPYLRENATIIFISFLLIPGHVIFPEWLFQGMEEMKYITYLNFGSKLIFTCLIFIFITTPADYLLQPLLLACGTFMAGFIGIIFVWKKWKIRLKPVPFSDIISSIKQSTDVFINTLIPNFYNSFSVILLGFFGGTVSNGYYDGGNKFNNIMSQFLQVISRAFFPFLARKIDKHDLFVQISLSISFLISIITFISAPWLIHTFLDGTFDQSITVLRILCPSIFFLTLSSAYGTNYLVLVGEERLLRNTTFVASILGFCMAIPLVYSFDYIGAAITISLTRILLGSMIYFRAKRHKSLSKT